MLKFGKKIEELREEEGLSKAALAKQLEVSPSAVGQYEADAIKPKYEVLIKLGSILKYDFINDKPLEESKEENEKQDDMEKRDGNIKMIRRPRLEADAAHLASDPWDFDFDGNRFTELPDGTYTMRVPIIPYKAYAGYLHGFQDPEYYEDFETLPLNVFKKHKGVYLAFEVKGDSMTTYEPEHAERSVYSGRIAVGRDLQKHHWKSKLHINSDFPWVIIHKTEGILIKDIIDHDVEKGLITIHSLNPDKTLYPDEVLALEDIEQIFDVVQIVKRRK